MFDVDNDPQTGVIMDDYGSVEGIDMLVYSCLLYTSDAADDC